MLHSFSITVTVQSCDRTYALQSIKYSSFVPFVSNCSGLWSRDAYDLAGYNLDITSEAIQPIVPSHCQKATRKLESSRYYSLFVQNEGRKMISFQEKNQQGSQLFKRKEANKYIQSLEKSYQSYSAILKSLDGNNCLHFSKIWSFLSA